MLERRFSSPKARQDLRAEWLTERVSAIKTALETLYANRPRARVRVHQQMPYHATVSVVEDGKLDPLLTVRVTPRAYGIEHVDGMNPDRMLRTLQSVMGPGCLWFA